MVHKHSVAGARALGDTGLYVGGLAAAVELTDRGGAKPEDFKFFFSHLAWPDGVLEEQVCCLLRLAVSERLPLVIVRATKTSSRE